MLNNIVQYLKKRRQRWHFTWVKAAVKQQCQECLPYTSYAIYAIWNISHMPCIIYVINRTCHIWHRKLLSLVRCTVGHLSISEENTAFEFWKGAPWKQVSSFLWQCFNALNSRADVERKECNNILAKLLQILLTFRDVGRWNQTVRGTILSKGHLKDSILEYKWIYSSQLWIT